MPLAHSFMIEIILGISWPMSAVSPGHKLLAAALACVPARRLPTDSLLLYGAQGRLRWRAPRVLLILDDFLQLPYGRRHLLGGHAAIAQHEARTLALARVIKARERPQPQLFLGRCLR